jgi:PIN domain nuclease of toxin-antitoxin system
MNILLDTCALLWWWAEPESLSARCLSMFQDPVNVFWVSSASAWEVATKYRIGKLPLAEGMIASWDERLETDSFRELRISWKHAIKAGTMAGQHRDPFDRMLVAQSLLERMPVMTSDPAIRALGAETLW